MPKMKTKKAAAKRFRINKRGKVKHKKQNLRHLLTTRSRNAKRKLRSAAYAFPGDAAKIKDVMPYG